MVVTESERVGSFLGHPIFKITTLKVLPCDHSLQNSPEEQVNTVLSSFLLNMLLVMMDLKISKNYTTSGRKRWRLSSLSC